MSGTDTSSLITGFPLAAHGLSGGLLDLLGGGILAAAGWGLIRFQWPQAEELITPLMLASYGLTGMITVGACRELLDSIRQRRAIPEMSLTLSGDAVRRNPSDRRQRAGERDQAVWSQILEELQHHQHRYEQWEMPAILVGLSSYWRETLDRRSLAGIVLAACILILGLFAGLSRLELNGPGKYLEGFNTVFSPLIVSSVLAAMAVVAILVARFHWDGTLLRWQKKSHDLVMERIEAEELIRQEESPKTRPTVPPPPVVPPAGQKPPEAPVFSHSDVPEKPWAAPSAPDLETKAVPPVEEAPDPWGAFGNVGAGVRVRDRRELDQADGNADAGHE